MFSCVRHKSIIYLQKSQSMAKDTVAKADFEYKVQAKDRLYITVNSYNSEVTNFFNLQGGGVNQGRVGAQALMYAYFVKESGYIEIPMLDSIKVSGFSVTEIQESLQKSIREQVPDAYVLVRLANYQVTMMGEVGREGIVTSTLDRLTIFDAISMAGGVTEFGDRKRIKVVRSYKDTASVILTVNLTKRDIFASECYYLHPGDMIYVERMRAKTYMSNLSNISRVVGIIVGFILVERTLNNMF